MSGYTNSEESSSSSCPDTSLNNSNSNNNELILHELEKMNKRLKNIESKLSRLEYDMDKLNGKKEYRPASP